MSPVYPALISRCMLALCMLAVAARAAEEPGTNRALSEGRPSEEHAVRQPQKKRTFSLLPPRVEGPISPENPPSTEALPPAFQTERPSTEPPEELPQAFVVPPPTSDVEPVPILVGRLNPQTTEPPSTENLPAPTEAPDPTDEQTLPGPLQLPMPMPANPESLQQDITSPQPLFLEPDRNALWPPTEPAPSDPSTGQQPGPVPEAGPVPDTGLETAPPGARPQQICWWESQIRQPLRHVAQPLPITVSRLISEALKHSTRIQVLTDTPLIRDTAIIEADGRFDYMAFLESKWTDIDEPVGNSLTTGGPPRFRNSIYDFEYGFRRQNRTGGQFEIGQAYGVETSNSVFFVPNRQGTAKLTLSYTQPLLRGGGRIYNTSLVLLANVDACLARDEFAGELQTHLTEIVKAYWALYLERGALLQRQRLYDRSREILGQLDARQMVDVVPNQLVRAQSAVAARRSELFRAAAGVKNAEARIRALVNSPDLGVLDEVEIVPQDPPAKSPTYLDLTSTIEVAIRHRPEVQVALRQIKSAGVRLDVTKNELLPMLDLILETYVAGLRGNRDVGGSFMDQFERGAPSYSAGLRMEVPLQNRVAKARFQRRALELRQFQNQFKTTLAALQLEVEIAVREVMTTYREIEAKGQALSAAEKEVEFIQGRWQLLAGDDRAASLVLEDLFAAQERLANQEFEYLSAEVSYNLAIVDLQRVMGTLLQIEGIHVQREECQGIPSLTVHQPEGRAADTLEGPTTTPITETAKDGMVPADEAVPPPYVSP